MAELLEVPQFGAAAGGTQDSVSYFDGLSTRLSFLSIASAALVLHVQLSFTRCGGRGSLLVLLVSDFWFKVPMESSW